MEEIPETTSEVQSIHFPDFGADGEAAQAVSGSGLLSGQSCLRVEYGRTDILRKDVVEWDAGATFTLPDPHAGLVTVRVDGQAVARGELVEVEGKLAVRVVELVSADEVEPQRKSA